MLLVGACRSTKSAVVSSEEQAEKTLEKDYLLIEANKYFLIGNHSLALSYLNQAIQRDPSCYACYYLKANVFSYVGMVDEAFEAAAVASEGDPSNRWYTILLAQLNIRKASFDAAANLYKSIIDSEGYSTDMYINLANVFGLTGEYEKAWAMLDTISAKEGYSEELALNRQQLYYRTGETAKALKEARDLNDYAPGNPQYLTIIADIYDRDGDMTNAETYYNSALQVDSVYMPALFGRLDVYRKKNDLATYFNELSNISKSSAVPFDSKMTYLSLVVSDPTLGVAGVPWLNGILADLYKGNETSWNYTFFYISYLMRSGEQQKALEVADTYMQVAAPVTSYDIWEVYLSLLNSAERWSELSSKTDEATSIVGKRIPLQLFKSLSLWQQGDIKGAISAVNEALKLQPDTAQYYELYAFMGDLYHVDGSQQKAFDTFDKALKYNPEGVVVLNNYAYYLSENDERLTDALKMSKKAVEQEPNNPTYLDTYGWILHKMGLNIEAKNTFRQAIMYGGRSMSVVLNHYGDVLYALEELDTAIIYWEFAAEAEDCDNPEMIKQKITQAKSQL